MKASSALAASVTDANSTRSRHEIDGEIFRLYQLLNQAPGLFAPGECNRDAIRVQVAVLRERMTMEAMLERYEETDADILSAALNALEWLEGKAPAPSDGWRELLAA